MRSRECLRLIQSDLKRLTGRDDWRGMILKLLFNASFKITFWFRLGTYLQQKKNPFFKILYIIVFLIHKHNMYKTGIQLLFGTDVKEGLSFSHFSCTVINQHAKIGRNFTMFNGCTVGSTFGRNSGVPIIGDNVLMCSGSKIIGRVTIGNNVVVGAGAIVVKDIPDNAVVVGIPAKIINYNGSEIVSHYRIN